ncbi:MAG: phospho-N-acetylmuramoyl-pentapeptide-transferase, partial [Oscillospiraceae bacterium]|nr:phospho-N-acetylmuramoyl-pentapeptide-transferase [Oscillospiraceae bacterium]
PWLKRLKYGQTIKDIGPTWHAGKQGTPTMGGIIFVGGILLACLVALPVYILWSGGSPEPAGARVCAGLGMGILYGLVGFFDDYVKIVNKRNLGLTAYQKLIFQFGIAFAYLATIYFSGDKGAGATYIPFVGRLELGFWFYLISIVMIVGFVNAVNLTDGIDGLCSSVTFFAAVSLMLAAGFSQAFEMGILAAAVAGGCVGFLMWNFFPAKVFMGDTGAFFLGGLFCALAFGMNMPVLIPVVGIIYLCEAGSVIIQRYYYKLTHGKRIFKMSPIHHHFEMCGWSEVKIVVVFSAVTLVFGVAAAILVFLG